jgi:hypothetical protein
VKILLARGRDIDIDLKRSADILNRVCSEIEIETCEGPIDFGTVSSYIVFEEEIGSLDKSLSRISRDYVIYVTSRKYPDNYFYYAAEDMMILSFSGWKYYTNLPLENGLFYFIAHALALRIDRSFRHEGTTGCVYDFLENKTDVDIGMKMGYICEDCLERLRKKTANSPDRAKILVDLIKVLTVLSNASKLGRGILGLHEEIDIGSLDWSTYEDEVSQLYRDLGADVKQNLDLSGFQIDLYVEEETPSKQKIRSAIECKFYKEKVGNRVVNDFSRIIKTLKDSKLVDKGIIVSYSGFTKDAHAVAASTGIELLHFKDLKTRAGAGRKVSAQEPTQTLEKVIEEKEHEENKRKERAPGVFVLMPFSTDLDDVYYLGIAETAKKLACSCERVDEMEFVGSIVEKIRDSIVNSRIIIAELSLPNLNVYYELGYAHALKKPTILISKDISKAPFDVKGYNHIVYKNIIDLRRKLERRLRVIIMQPN